jgi:hypothetical protein
MPVSEVLAAAVTLIAVGELTPHKKFSKNNLWGGNASQRADVQ